MFDWSVIDTVLLDMDGTLLDLHFDNHFWLNHVPSSYGAAKGMTFAEAKDVLEKKYADVAGTLEWYCIDHWSQQLGLDIALLKQEVNHLIQVHPHVLEFLNALKEAGKRRILVTNAHQKSIALKMEMTQLHGHLDGIICSHELGMPKEDIHFWHRLQREISFDRQRTLFVDDSLAVLKSARDYGMGHLLAILLPDSQQPLRQVHDFDGIPAVQDFSSLLPIDAQAAD